MECSNRKLLSALLVLLFGVGIRSEECNSQRMQQCKSAIADALSREDTSSSRRTTAVISQRQEQMNQCRSILDNMHCFVWQTSNCLGLEERERNGDYIYKAWKYLSTSCDTIVGWRISNCFQREDVRRCESLVRETSRNPVPDNCRKYISFKDCVTNIVTAQCNIDDQSTMTMYFLDIGREKAWKCSSADNRDREYFQHQTQPLAEGGGDTQDAVCLSRSSGSIRECSDRYYRDQDEARRSKDNQDRMHKECCASINFDHCVRDTVRDRCQYVRETVVQTILDQNLVRQEPRCRYYSVYECSGATTGQAATSILLFVAAVISMAKTLY